MGCAKLLDARGKWMLASLAMSSTQTSIQPTPIRQPSAPKASSLPPMRTQLQPSLGSVYPAFMEEPSAPLVVREPPASEDFVEVRLVLKRTNAVRLVSEAKRHASCQSVEQLELSSMVVCPESGAAHRRR